jgi:uncharacterized hydrophobic protein (TIGR00271 family)
MGDLLSPGPPLKTPKRTAMDLTISWLRVSPERQEAVIREIDYGCRPGGRFYALVATSTLIACLGLIANSTAVIIGAMLVAPLMTPIFGISLSLVRGEGLMLGRAIRAEIMGVVVAVGLAALFGSLPMALTVTPEMLARTQPNLLDLLVAVLAGFAGAYAMINEHLSPALPGVAIATAIVPPLANVGLCLAVGAYDGAYGSFLLFLANFLSILVVSSLVFIGAGLVQAVPIARWGFARRFGMPALGFMVVTFLLTPPLVHIVKDRYLTGAIKRVINGQLAQLPTTAMFKMAHEQHLGQLYILATVRTPRVIEPYRVKVIQDSLDNALGLRTHLILRCVLNKDISALGSTSEITDENLNGSFLATRINPKVLQIQVAEQVLRDLMFSMPLFQLEEVNEGHSQTGPVVVAIIEGPRALMPSEVQRFQTAIRRRLNDYTIRLVARCEITENVDARGRILYGWSHFALQPPKQHAKMNEIDSAIRETFRQFKDIFVINVDAAPRDDGWQARVEVTGAHVITPAEAGVVEKIVADRLHHPVKIFFFSQSQAMVTPQGYTSVDSFIQSQVEKSEPTDSVH